MVAASVVAIGIAALGLTAINDSKPEYVIGVPVSRQLDREVLREVEKAVERLNESRGGGMPFDLSVAELSDETDYYENGEWNSPWIDDEPDLVALVVPDGPATSGRTVGGIRAVACDPDRPNDCRLAVNGVYNALTEQDTYEAAEEIRGTLPIWRGSSRN